MFAQSESEPFVSFHSVPKCEDFFSRELILTDKSKELFELGSDGQGYIGLVDLKNCQIHLVPAFNKNDGLVHVDKNGKRFTQWLQSIQQLGGNTGDLHMQGAAILQLGNKAGANGLLMGFGLWKGGIGVKFLSEMPESSLRLIPNEYLLVKNNNDQTWQLMYVNQKRETEIISMETVPGLIEAINKLPNTKKPEQLNYEERREVEQVLRDSDLGKENKAIKFLKNRSSSQNMFSCIYDPMYTVFFNNSLTAGHGSAHSLALRRELPLPVFQKIMDSIGKQLDITGLERLQESPLIPDDTNDNRLRFHLKIESDWMKLLEKLAQNNILTNENKQVIADNAKHAKKITNALISLAKGNILTNENREFIAKHPEYADVVSNALILLAQENILTSINGRFIVDNAPYAERVSKAFIILAKNEILTDENKALICEYNPYAMVISNALVRLAQEKILEKENRDIIVKNYQCAEVISNALVFLSQKKILTTENRDLIAEHPQYASILSNALVKLAETDILTNESRDLIAKHPEHAGKISNALVKLAEADILTDENRDLIEKHSQHAEKVSEALVQLTQEDILTNENRKRIDEDPENADLILLVHRTFNKS